MKMLWKFNSVYNPALQLTDHRQLVQYEMALPLTPSQHVNPEVPYIHHAKGRHIDDSTEQFVEATRMGTAI